MNYLKQLRSNGYRLTPQREIILDSLQRQSGHLSIGQITELVEKRSSAIDRATIYRTLALFEELGIVHSSKIAGQLVYEVVGEEPHHHLVCRECGSVQHLDDYHFDTIVEHLMEEHQFEAELTHLTIPGLCSACQEEGN